VQQHCCRHAVFVRRANNGTPADAVSCLLRPGIGAPDAIAALRLCARHSSQEHDIDSPSIADIEDFIRRHERITVLTGAGCSTDSGIPDYRDLEGQWKRSPPMTYQVFTGSEAARRRYWARSMLGWPLVAAARPNAAHYALAELERRGRTTLLITQNVDGLHQRAGSRRVVDLHGRLDRVVCLDCGAGSDRVDLQHRMIAMNPRWLTYAAEIAPDGDADLDGLSFDDFHVPPCEVCGGTLKPDVVFFGESVPRQRPQQGMEALEQSDSLLVVGSSLMVFSGFRFARRARDLGLPIAAVNLGRSRADDFLTLRVQQPAAEALAFLAHPDPRQPQPGAALPA
jgi:NAD-dependent SIR2 family protein deacetylase